MLNSRREERARLWVAMATMLDVLTCTVLSLHDADERMHQAGYSTHTGRLPARDICTSDACSFRTSAVSTGSAVNFDVARWRVSSKAPVSTSIT